MSRLIFCLSFLLIAIHAQKLVVPIDLKSKIERSRNFGDLFAHVTIGVMAPATGGNHANSDSADFKIDTASVTKQNHRARLLSASATGDALTAVIEGGSLGGDHHLETLKGIKQGEDTCKLQPVCVPVDVEIDDESVLVYPMCYEVNRCVGSCCKAGNECHAHSKREVSKVIVELGYIGRDRFKINRSYNITLEEHTLCSCNRCPDHVKQCPEGLVIGPSCGCECPNQSEMEQCKGDPTRTWHDASCSCSCPAKTCTAQQHFDRANCECKDRASDDVPKLLAPEDQHRIDIANLPKLNHRRRHGHGHGPRGHA